MEKNLYFKHVYGRKNLIKDFFLNLFLSISSYPRLVIEVIIRKNFGERYFNLASAITVCLILIFLPVAANSLFRVPFNRNSSSEFWLKYGTWYAYIILFTYCSFLRWKELKRNPTVFNFAKFSLYSGDILWVFIRNKIFGKYQNLRTIEILLEPAIFFIAGILLYKLGQNLGMLFIVTSLIYSFSYSAAYRIGDNFSMDLLDEKLMNEERENAYVNDLPPQKTRGVRYNTRKPERLEDRKKLAEAMVENEEISYAF